MDRNVAKPKAFASQAVEDASIKRLVDEGLEAFMRTGDEARFLAVLAEELRLRRTQGDALLRCYDSDGNGAAETMVITFGGLQLQVGGGHGGGVAPHEFVRSCQKAGARYALFVRDVTRSWYCRGLGPAFGNGASCDSFDAMIAGLRAEIARLRPRRVVTIGSSMGGYAAIRAGLALNATRAVAFSPQVII